MNFKYNIENAYLNTVSLHDCKVTSIQIDDADLIFNFEDNGFWVIAGSEYNNSDKTLRTTKSSIRFTNAGDEYSVTAYIHGKYSFLKKLFLTTRKEIDLKELQQKVNSKKWCIEIVYERYNRGEVFFQAYIMTDKRKIIECQIEISFKKMIYSWNELNKDFAF